MNSTNRTDLRSIALEHRRKLSERKVIVRPGGEKMLGQTPYKIKRIA
jgi:hypothetical protein